MSMDPTDRLIQSRHAMAQWLAQHPRSHGDSHAGATAGSSASPSNGSFDAAQASSLPCKANAWVAMAVSSLGVGLLGSRRETLTPWALAGAAAQAVLKPTASRHPWAVVAGASLLGAGLVMVRPWRLVGRRGIWGNLAVQLAWQGLRQASAAAALRATSPPPSPPSSPRPSQR